MKYILDLLTTMDEGLAYIQKKDKEANFEAGVSVLVDFSSGIGSIENAIYPMLKDLNRNQIQFKMDETKKALAILLNEFKINRYEKVIEIMEFQLKPSFTEWKQELENILQPYTLS